MKRTCWPGFRFCSGKTGAKRLDDGLGLVGIGADLGDDAGERVAAADLHHLQLAAVEQIVGDLV